MIICPVCDTHYNPEGLGIKVGPTDKSILWCKICGKKLLVKARLQEVVADREPKSWRNLWMGGPGRIIKVVRYLVEIFDGD